VVLRGEETERHWSVTFPDPQARARFRWQGLFRAPVLVVAVTEPGAYVSRYGEPDKVATGLGAGADAWAVPFWWVDAGMAVENVLLAAVGAGLGACFFGLFDHEEAVLQALGVPSGRRGVGTIALGHPAQDELGRSVQRERRPNLHWTGWSR
jgi:nitroreductase